jgi:hypothetical protein
VVQDSSLENYHCMKPCGKKHLDQQITSYMLWNQSPTIRSFHFVSPSMPPPLLLRWSQSILSAKPLVWDLFEEPLLMDMFHCWPLPELPDLGLPLAPLPVTITLCELTLSHCYQLALYKCTVKRTNMCYQSKSSLSFSCSY